MTRKTRITIETDSLLVLRGRKPLRAWCQECGAEEEMIPLNEVGIVSNLPPPAVRAWMQAEELHQGITADGSPLICLNSMLKRLRASASTASPRDEQP
jgi:hypothetical protein